MLSVVDIRLTIVSDKELIKNARAMIVEKLNKDFKETRRTEVDFGVVSRSNESPDTVVIGTSFFLFTVLVIWEVKVNDDKSSTWPTIYLYQVAV